MYAAIDVGSNTVRLLLGEVVEGKVIPAQYVRRITRLKGGQTAQGLAPEAMRRTLDALREFSDRVKTTSPARVRAVATEALRRAANREQFCRMVRDETGLELEVIAGEVEAELGARGVCSVIRGKQTLLVFDIGGGSTEFVLVHDGQLLFRQSLKLGVVDLSERIPQAAVRQKMIEGEIFGLHQMLQPVLVQHAIEEADITLVGTAGTVTTLAALDMAMVDYDWQRVNGYSLSGATITALYSRLIALTPQQREELPGMEAGRGDLIPAGIEIILAILRSFRAESLTVSDFGLLEGILLQMPEQSGTND